MDSFLDKLIRYLRIGQVKKYVLPGSIVCDIGSGKDPFFLKEISGTTKLAIGIDEEIADFKNQKYQFKKQKISQKIFLENESCDAVTMAAVLEHLLFPQDILNECFRILKPQGRLILTTPAPLSRPVLNFLAKTLRLIDKGEIDDHKNYFTAEQVRAMLKKSGFAEKKIKSQLFRIFFK